MTETLASQGNLDDWDNKVADATEIHRLLVDFNPGGRHENWALVGLVRDGVVFWADVPEALDEIS